MNKIKFYLAGIFCVCLTFGISHLALANATISGTLIDNTGAPLHGVYIDAYLNEEVFYDVSEDNGSYEIEIDDPNPITSGNYTLKVEGFGITDDTDLNLRLFYCYPQTETIYLVDGDVKTKNFTLIKHGMIVGSVLDSDNNPIYAATLHFWNPNNNLEVTEESNQIGKYFATPPYIFDEIFYLLLESFRENFAQNTQGNFHAYVTAPGYLSKYISKIEVRDNQTTTKNISLTRKSYATGTIKNKNHAKLNNILIQAYKFGETTPYTETVTDINGNYQIEIGKTGSAEDFGDFSVAGQNFIITAGSDPDSHYGPASKKLSFSRDQVTKIGINFTLGAKNKSLHGKVKNAKGKILKDAKVEVRLLSNPSIFSFDYSNSNGVYRINNLVSGLYQITVTKSNYTEIQIASLKIKKNLHKDFKIQSAGVISGFIYNKIGKEPIEDLTVRLVGSDLTAVTDSNGYYKISNVQVGSHKIFVKNPAYLEQVSGKVKVQKNKIVKNLNLALTSYARTLK